MTDKKTVRTRVAPSPTGDPHVGTAYIALFNAVFAAQHGGEFIVRIEDTDRQRSTPESEQTILEALNWLGLSWHEGPDVGGEYGPYRQSERQAIYQRYVQQLQDEGHAFPCFCSTERLAAVRAEQLQNKQTLGYDGHCLKLSAEVVAERLKANEPHTVRMKVPTEGVCTINDLLRGTIEIDWSQVDQQVLMKTDGMPTYHLANVVDDHLMKITHVIRGEEWISSAPKHALLYRYFGWEMPELCHMPLLRNPDKSKLSKRKNPTSILFYQKMGYLPEALLNYLGRMGWSMPDESEKFTLAQMIEAFDLTRVSLGGPVFDREKLNWLNGQWIRESLSTEDFIQRVTAWAFDDERLSAMVPHVQQRVETFSDIAPLMAFLYSGFLPMTAADFQHKKLSTEEVQKILQFALWRFEENTVWTRDALQQRLTQLADQMSMKLRDFMAPFFIAIAGSSASIPVMDSMVLLGPDMTRARLRDAISVLGGVSKKDMKRWEKAYRALPVS